MLAVVNAIDVQMEALAVPAGVCHSMARAGSRRPRSPLVLSSYRWECASPKVEPADAPMHGGRRLHGPYSG